MRIILEIDDVLYSKAKEMKIDIRTFLEVKLFEYVTGRESLAISKPLNYREIKTDFEKWLKSKISRETAERYLNKLESLGEITVESLTNLYQSNPTNNTAKAIRNLVNFLEEREIIDPKTANRIRKIAEIKKSKPDKMIPTDEDVREAFRRFKKLRPDDFLVALIILYSGARVKHVLRMLKEFDERYLVFKDGFARYEISHLSEGFKEGFWIYMPDWLAKRLKKVEIDYGVKDRLNYKTKSGRTVSPKYIRKWFNNLLVKLKIDKDVRNFILGRRREIKFSVEADNYLELLQLADEEYKRIVEEVSKLCQIDGTGWHRYEGSSNLPEKEKDD